MHQFNFEEHSHRRFNPLTGDWLQVSPHRAKRPWQGQQEKVSEEKRPTYDPTCYLCPGNTRANGEQNPVYTGTYAFKNDFAAITEDAPAGQMEEGEFFLARSERGLCKVICFSPRHDLTIPEMEVDEIAQVVRLWQQEYAELGRMDFVNYVQIFENKGQVMGCSNPHPHGQVWAQESVPDEPAKKQARFSVYYKRHGRSMLLDYLQEELKKQERILFENDHFVGLVPFWAVWPFEAMIVPKRHVPHVGALSEKEVVSMADAYKQLTVMYDNLFEISFPYSAGIHQAPTDALDHPEWDMHLVFFPPLLRSATVKKFMVGYEMLANPQRDITPESSAARMRELAKVHYKKR
ncbi:UDP-glucose--hexose-1-phosphate uridylyltransferase [Pontibacter sp. CAU 1760]